MTERDFCSDFFFKVYFPNVYYFFNLVTALKVLEIKVGKHGIEWFSYHLKPELVLQREAEFEILVHL